MFKFIKTTQDQPDFLPEECAGPGASGCISLPVLELETNVVASQRRTLEAAVKEIYDLHPCKFEAFLSLLKGNHPDILSLADEKTIKAYVTKWRKGIRQRSQAPHGSQ